MRTALFGVFTAFFLACGAFGAGGDDDDDGPKSTPVVHDASVADVTSAADVAVPDATPDAPSCANAMTIQGTGVADVGLTACDGANSYGSTDFMNIGVGDGILRVKFSLADVGPLAAKLVVNEKAVISATLTLTTRPHCSACDNGIPTSDGAIGVYVMRNDWEEGTTGGRTAPDKCRRVVSPAEIGWGSGTPSAPSMISAPADYSTVPNPATLVKNAVKIDVPIVPTELTWKPELLTQGLLSFYVKTLSGKVIISSHEGAADKNSPTAAPLVTVTYCKD